MKPGVRIMIYAVLVIAAIVLARGFYRAYHSTAEPPTPPVDPIVEQQPERVDPQRNSRMMSYGLSLFVVLVILAILLARDIGGFLATRVEDFILSDKGEALKDPEYEQAEQVWANGEFLQAIQLMRQHLEKNPRHQYVTIRIAEIYEKDLKNYLAAALEYEQLLHHRLPDESWGWKAIHLANLYSGKLDRIEDAEQLLHRIVNEYGHTTAARKARARLGIPEPEATPATDPEQAAETADPPSNLPPGFRPK